MDSFFDEEKQKPPEFPESDLSAVKNFKNLILEAQTREIDQFEIPYDLSDFSEDRWKSDSFYAKKNEISSEEKQNQQVYDQNPKDFTTSDEMPKNEPEVSISEEKGEFTKGTIDYKQDSFDSLNKDFQKNFKESSAFSPIIELKALSDVNPQTLLGKKTKRNTRKRKTLNQLEIKKNVSEASKIKKQTSTSSICNQRFENTDIEEKIDRPPCFEINDSCSTLTENSFTNDNYKDDSGKECLEKSSDLSVSLNKEKTKKIIFRIFKLKKKNSILLQEASTASNLTDFANFRKQEGLLNQSKEKTQTSDGKSKMRRDSINKKIKAHFFKYLIQKFGIPALFSQNFITNIVIGRNKLLMEKSIGEVIYECLLEKNNFKVKIAEKQLAKIRENSRIKKDEFTSKLNDLYDHEYFYSKECTKKFAKVFEKESEIYAKEYEFRLNTFVKYFREEKGNNKNGKNKGKKGRKN